MRNQDQKQQALLQGTLDNITNKLRYQLFYDQEQEKEIVQNYYLLVKKEKRKPYCLLFLTNYNKIWIKKITYLYVTQLRNKMKLKTDVKFFLEYLAQGLKQSTELLFSQQSINETEYRAKYPVLKVSLKISNGFVLKCDILVDDCCVDIMEDTDDFRRYLRIFGQQFYQAKQYQYKQALIMVDIVKQQNLQKNTNTKQIKQKEKILTNKIFGKQETKIIPQKNRDLINPFRKKRKGLGMKIRRQSDEQQYDSYND